MSLEIEWSGNVTFEQRPGDVMFEQRPERSKERRQVCIWGGCSGQRCTASARAPGLGHAWCSRRAGVAGGDWAQGGVDGRKASERRRGQALQGLVGYCTDCGFCPEYPGRRGAALSKEECPDVAQVLEPSG